MVDLRKLTAGIPPAYLVGAGLAGLVVLVLTLKGAKGAGQAVGGGVVDLVGGVLGGANDALPEAIRPTSSSNVVNGAVSLIGAAVTGQDARDFSLGARIFEWFNPATVAAEKRAVNGP
jgi:hypothetical protein